MEIMKMLMSKKYDEKCLHWRKLHKESFTQLRKRVLFTIGMALAFYFTVYKLILNVKAVHFERVIFTVVVFFIFTEVILLFDRLIARKFPWHEAVKKRVVSLFIFAIVIFIITSNVVPDLEHYFIGRNILIDKQKYNLSMMVGFLYLVIYVVLIIAGNYHKTLNYFLVENEKLKQDKILSDYKALQDQLNPHFLFNNLSTLIAIIHTDKEKAINFAENFTDVYRYVLTKEGQVAITVQDELKFLDAYTTLHMARIGEGLSVKVAVDEVIAQKKVPHLSLQVLVENAIKHNVTSRTRPLVIQIGVNNGKLYVANNKQLKDSTYSTKTGLSNLSKRLKILTDEELEVIEDDVMYRVEIPLIN